MKKAFKILPILILAIFVLSGCTNQVYDINVLEDGRVSFSETFAIDVDILNKMHEKKINFGKIYKQNKDSVDDMDKIHPLFQESAWVFANKDFNIEPVEDSVQVGFKASKEYPNIEAFNSDLKTLYMAGLSTIKAQLTHDKNIMGENYQLAGEFSFLKDPEFKTSDEEIAALKELVKNPNFNAIINIKTPGDLKDHNGEIQGGKVVFRAPDTALQPTKILLQSGFESDKGKMIIVVGAAVGILAVGFLVLKNYRKIKFIIFRK